MTTIDTKYTRDGTWQVELVAFRVNWFFYKAIGTTLRVRTKVTRGGFWGWLFGPGPPTWEERPVASLVVTNTYEGFLPNLDPGTTSRSCQARDASSCDCRLWAIGINVSVDATASSGFPDAGTTLPTPGASLDVRKVHGSATALIAGELVRVGEVEAS